MKKQKIWKVGDIRKWKGIRNSDTGQIENGYLYFITKINGNEISSTGKYIEGKNRSEAIKNYKLKS